jgi:phospholipase C
MFAVVISPCRVEPASVNTGLTRLGLTYLPGTDHGWAGTHAAWNQGQCDNWAVQTPLAISYVTRDNLPYHYA